MKYLYTPKGVCARAIELEIEDGIIKQIDIEGGCKGNKQGIIRLCQGRKADEVAELLKGICCGSRPTSCPDQLSIALNEALNQAE